MAQEDNEYRQPHRELWAELRLREQANQAAYDKAVMTLSGGALAISVAVVKDFFGGQAAAWSCTLLLAWIAWALSLTSILFSFHFSVLAQRKLQRDLLISR